MYSVLQYMEFTGKKNNSFHLNPTVEDTSLIFTNPETSPSNKGGQQLDKEDCASKPNNDKCQRIQSQGAATRNLHSKDASSPGRNLKKYQQNTRWPYKAQQ